MRQNNYRAQHKKRKNKGLKTVIMILSACFIVAILVYIAKHLQEKNNLVVVVKGEQKSTASLSQDITASTQTQSSQTQTTPECVIPKEIKVNFTEIISGIGNEFSTVAEVYPSNAENTNVFWTSSNTKVAIVDTKGNITTIGEGDCSINVYSLADTNVINTISVKVSDKYNTHVNGILVANKTYALLNDYNPGADEDAMSAFNHMKEEAEKENITLWIASGFRSYSRQETLYTNYVSQDGKEAADTYSARPGHSEHQTGLAFDLNEISDSFANTKEGKWLASNSYKYGFILRYPSDKVEITGYKFEPWHFRYIGVEEATKVFESGLCLEEYLGITSQYQN